MNEFSPMKCLYELLMKLQTCVAWMDLLYSEVAEYFVNLLFLQLKKRPQLRPSLPFFPPPPFAFCLPGSWTSESNFRTDKILGFSSAHTGVFFLAGYHVKRHMEQIKSEKQQQEEEEEEAALSLSLPSNSTSTIASITNTSFCKRDGKHLH